MVLSPTVKSVADRALHEEEAKRRHIVVALSGAHAYGFPSVDSDLDLKGIHLAPTEAMLGLRPRCPAAESIKVVENVELDYSSNELGGVLLGIIKGNGNYLERVLGRHILLSSPEHEELIELTQASLSRRSYRHYRGFAWQQRMALESHEQPTLKKLLYVLRTTLTGVHLLRTGELMVDLVHNAEEHGYIDALELIEAKVQGEQTLLTPKQRASWLRRIDGLFESLDDAVISSPLPHEAPNTDDIEAWLLAVRLRELDRRRAGN